MSKQQTTLNRLKVYNSLSKAYFTKVYNSLNNRQAYQPLETNRKSADHERTQVHWTFKKNNDLIISNGWKYMSGVGCASWNILAFCSLKEKYSSKVKETGQVNILDI